VIGELDGHTHAMSDNDPAKPLDDLLEAGKFVMLMTMIGAEHTSRPLTIADVSGHRLSFLIDATTDWAIAVRDGAAVVHATVADDRSNTYVAVNGDAIVTLDRAEIDRLWNPGAAAYFDGKDDPALAVLHLDVTDGEYWDGPSGRLGAAIQMVRAALASEPDTVGERGEIATG
jgi:general stress protein 26